MRRAAAALLLAAAVAAGSAVPAAAQSCPEPLASARRLALVTARGFATPRAVLRLYERPAPRMAWKAVSSPEPALIGKTGMAWSHFFRSAAQGDEPIKTEGDKRAPAGFFRIGKSFGSGFSLRSNYLRLEEGTTCVSDVSSPAYNTITSRSRVGWNVRGENMWRVPEYRRGLLIDYPTDARARAGSCIFIHLVSERIGTGGCVALPEARLEVLQSFAEPGAVLAILPEVARSRFAGCLPVN